MLKKKNHLSGRAVAKRDLNSLVFGLISLYFVCGFGFPVYLHQGVFEGKRVGVVTERQGGACVYVLLSSSEGEEFGSMVVLSGVGWIGV